MKKIILCLLLFIPFFTFCDEYNFFIDLRSRNLATFNDAVTLMRYVFAETTPSPNFRENIVWAAEKKLFKVSIPIKENTVNPIITREEFCSWLCKLFEIGGHFLPRNKNAAYKYGIKLGYKNIGFNGKLYTFPYFMSFLLKRFVNRCNL